MIEGTTLVVATRSGSTYTFTIGGPRYGTLGGGKLALPTLALFVGSQSDDADELVDHAAIVVGSRARFLCPLVGEIVTTPVVCIDVAGDVAA